MNGPTIMYTMPPLFKLDVIEVPKCMYSMKNIQQPVMNDLTRPSLGPNVPCASILEQKPLVELDGLEKRQEHVLKQLAELRQQMSLITDVLKSGITIKPLVQGAKETNSCGPIDVVINANPQHPPYSLIALYNRWKTSINMRINCHIHSSIQVISKELEEVFQVHGHTSQNSNHPVNVTLIWKNVSKDAELVLSPSNTVPIRGEVNALRFLSRAIPDLNVEDAKAATTVDAMLDTCHSLIWASSRERQPLLRMLSANLNKSQYFLGDNVSIVDIAVWSVLKQLSATQDLTVNMNKWFQQCNKMFMSNA